MVVTQYFEPKAPTTSRQDPLGQIVLRPNNSLSWKAAKFFLATLFTLSAAIAVGFTLQGYWVILLFTCIEMSALSACFWLILKRNSVQEVISFSADFLTLEVGRKHPEIRRQWQRFFTKIHIDKHRYPWYPNRVALRHKDEEQEIGRFLTADEKEELIRSLQEMVQHANAYQHS